jgi:hypothetical protein
MTLAYQKFYIFKGPSSIIDNKTDNGRRSFRYLKLTRIMMNAYRKQACPDITCWYAIQGLLAKQVLDRKLPIVQAIVDTRRESNSEINVEFEQCLMRATFNGYPLLK